MIFWLIIISVLLAMAILLMSGNNPQEAVDCESADSSSVTSENINNDRATVEILVNNRRYTISNESDINILNRAGTIVNDSITSFINCGHSEKAATAQTAIICCYDLLARQQNIHSSVGRERDRDEVSIQVTLSNSEQTVSGHFEKQRLAEAAKIVNEDIRKYSLSTMDDIRSLVLSSLIYSYDLLELENGSIEQID